LFENCCEEFSSLHEASTGPEDQVHDEAFTVEESICQENMEVLNDINCVSPRMEASDIISDASILLDVHNDQHASCRNCEFMEQMWSIVDGSPGYQVEAYVPSYPAYDDEDLPVFKEEMVVEEDFSLFLQGVSHDIILPGIKEKKIMYEHPEAADTTVPETDIFDGITILEEEYRNEGQPLFDEYYSDDEKQAYPTFDHYEDAARHDSKKSHPMVPIYDEYKFDSGESQPEEEKEPEEQNIFCPEPVSKQPPPESNEPTLVVHQPILIIDIQPHVNNCVAKESVCRSFSGICHSFYEPVSKYMEWHFLYALEPPTFIFTETLEDESKDVTILISWLHRLLSIIDRRKEILFRKLLEWLWWKFAFT
jgi:hypothetical protein